MVETIDDMDQDFELIDNKNDLLADKIKISDRQIIRDMEQINLIDFFDETDRVMKRLTNN